jgi:alpha/beta superfamily hydrolase
MGVMFSGKRLLPASHGQLEAIYRPTRDDAERVALVLHPHPLYGGTMHNPVVFHCARALQELGYETLRINFRGVGESSGEYAHGRGEVEDARTALDFLLAAQPAARQVLVAGFSFGAAIGLELGCADPRVNQLLAIGTPAGHFDLRFLARCSKAKLFVHGERDDVAPLAALQALLRELPQPADLRVLPGGSHFFEGQLDALREAILAGLDS